MATEDLKQEILELKKHLHTVSSENYLLKVKVRKLQNELDGKNKQIDCLLDPNKTTCIRKIISERGATMIINLKERNNELEENLIEKNNIIRKLQSDIQISKTYLAVHNKNYENRHVPSKCKESINESSKIKLRSRSLSVTPVPRQSYLKSSSDIQLEYVRLAQNLQKIKLANRATKQRSSAHTMVANKTKSTVENRLAKTSMINTNDYSYRYSEIKDVEKNFLNLLEEMEKLKNTVSKLTTEQENTKKILKEKNRNIEILARKVKHLQKSKFMKSSNKSPNNLKTIGKNVSEEQSTSSIYSYSQESFEESSNDNSPEKLSKKNSIEQTSTSEAQTLVNSDDDDVETGDSK